MNIPTTKSQYYGDKSSYPRLIKDISANTLPNMLVDVVFEELVENKVFIAEAKMARKGVIHDISKYPNLSLKYSKYIKK